MRQLQVRYLEDPSFLVRGVDPFRHQGALYKIQGGNYLVSAAPALQQEYSGQAGNDISNFGSEGRFLNSIDMVLQISESGYPIQKSYILQQICFPHIYIGYRILKYNYGILLRYPCNIRSQRRVI